MKVLAGGSDLLGGVMKDWVHGKGMPLPDVAGRHHDDPGAARHQASGGGPRIGAATTLTDIVESAESQQKFPVLDAGRDVASPRR